MCWAWRIPLQWSFRAIHREACSDIYRARRSKLPSASFAGTQTSLLTATAETFPIWSLRRYAGPPPSGSSGVGRRREFWFGSLLCFASDRPAQSSTDPRSGFSCRTFLYSWAWPLISLLERFRTKTDYPRKWRKWARSGRNRTQSHRWNNHRTRTVVFGFADYFCKNASGRHKLT